VRSIALSAAAFLLANGLFLSPTAASAEEAAWGDAVASAETRTTRPIRTVNFLGLS
jgi:hypothetical protein